MKSLVGMPGFHLHSTFRPLWALAVLFLCWTSGCGRGAAMEDFAPIEEVSGSRTRIVWCRQAVGDGTDAMGSGAGFVLMGLDTRDGHGERVILGDVSSYRKPMLDPAGERIVFSNRKDHQIGVVRWDGSGLEFIRGGMALDVWRDPQTGATWVYYVVEVKDNVTADGHPVRRFRLDRPEEDELVWDRTWVSADSFQISADGRIAAGQFPWKDAGIAQVPQGRLHITGQGCWTGIAPDNSYDMWIFDGAHKNLLIKPFGSTAPRKVRLNTAPGTDNHEVYHPRWSNHPLVLAITGPYKIQRQHNAILGGGKGINVYLGRFSGARDRVESWAQVTRHDQADFFPDVWIEGADLAAAGSPAAPAPGWTDVPATWPLNTDGLVFAWEHAKAANRIHKGDDEEENVCKVVRRGRARWNRFFEARLDGGWLELEAGKSGAVADLSDSTAFSLEAVVTPPAQSVDESCVISQSTDPAGEERFALVQNGMRMGLRTREGLSMAAQNVDADSPQHVVLVYDAGLWTVYLNGFRAGTIRDGGHEWRDEPARSLRFGRDASGGSDWGGAVGGIAVYERALSPEEIAAHWRYVRETVSARVPVSRLVFRGRLVERTDSPMPESIRPYRDGLVEYVYEVVEVLEGECEEERIIVQHWAILDGTSLPIEIEPGGTDTVHVESVGDHPELEGERVSSTVEDPLLDVYVDIASFPRRDGDGE